MAAQLTDSTISPLAPSLLPLEPPQLASPRRTPYLPIEVITDEILPKLPTKTLLRFKSVCKSFKTLISSPEFARRHTPSSDNRFLIVPGHDLTVFSYNLDSPSASPAFCWTLDSISGICSCNGLVLVSCSVDNSCSLVLLNPATRTYIDIIHPSIEHFLSCRFWLGFGFDDLQNDYKIVTLSKEFDSKTRTTSVYSVNSKSWNVLEECPLPLEISVRRIMDGSVLINNRLLHWGCFCLASKRPRIVCFDIVSEKWMDDVLLPRSFYSSDGYFLNLGVLMDDRLFASFENVVRSGNEVLYLDVWVMKEYGVNDSWVKLCSIPKWNYNEYYTLVPIASRGEGSREILLWQWEMSKLIWYNREDNETEDVPIRVPEASVDPFICKASLVILPDSKLYKSNSCA